MPHAASNAAAAIPFPVPLGNDATTPTMPSRAERSCAALLTAGEPLRLEWFRSLDPESTSSREASAWFSILKTPPAFFITIDPRGWISSHIINRGMINLLEP